MSDSCSIHSETEKAYLVLSSESSSASVTLVVDHNQHVYSDVDPGNENELVMSCWDVTEIINHHLDENSHLDTVLLHSLKQHKKQQLLACVCSSR
jgi:hypothetical protein